MALYNFVKDRNTLEITKVNGKYHIAAFDGFCNLTFDVAYISPLSDAATKVLYTDKNYQFFYFSKGYGFIQTLPEDGNGIEYKLFLEYCGQKATLILPESEVVKLVQLEVLITLRKKNCFIIFSQTDNKQGVLVLNCQPYVLSNRPNSLIYAIENVLIDGKIRGLSLDGGQFGNVWKDEITGNITIKISGHYVPLTAEEAQELLECLDTFFVQTE